MDAVSWLHLRNQTRRLFVEIFPAAVVPPTDSSLSRIGLSYERTSFQ